MTNTAGGNYLFKSIQSSSSPSLLNKIDIAFVGDSVDDRGSASIDYVRSSNCPVHTVRFDSGSHEIYVDGRQARRDVLTGLLKSKQHVLLDATTLGLGEILLLLLACKNVNCGGVEFIYAEPKKYTQNRADQPNNLLLRDFSLTENCRFSSIHGFAHQYEKGMNASHIFFLGFEPGRIQSAHEERGDIDNKKYKYHIIIGMPAFKAGWESNTIRPHLSVLEDLQITERSITYCQANSIRESYTTLWELYRQLGDERGGFFVSPIGTKPHTVGAALFLLETKGKDPLTSLYYDHPIRTSHRSSDIATWHHVRVTF